MPEFKERSEKIGDLEWLKEELKNLFSKVKGKIKNHPSTSTEKPSDKQTEKAEDKTFKWLLTEKLKWNSSTPTGKPKDKQTEKAGDKTFKWLLTEKLKWNSSTPTEKPSDQKEMPDKDPFQGLREGEKNQTKQLKDVPRNIPENKSIDAPLKSKYKVSWDWEKVKQFEWYLDRADEYLKNNATLSKEDFNEYFCWDGSRRRNEITWMIFNKGESYGQKNVWNCYLVAAIRAIIESPVYEHLIRTSVSFNKEKKEFTVSLPLWNKNAKKYVIWEELMKPQKNKFYNPEKAIRPQRVPLQQVHWDSEKGSYYAVIDKQGKPVLFDKDKEYLKPMGWPLWIVALESAFMCATTKDASWNIDRLRMEWWRWNDALEVMLWTNNTDQNHLDIHWNEQKITKFFDEFSSLTDYATLWSLRLEGWSDKVFYNVEWTNIKLAHNHAYAIVETDPVKKTVTLVEPSKFNSKITLTYQQMISNFDALRACKVDYKNGFT